jgi:hypothetical protein
LISSEQKAKEENMDSIDGKTAGPGTGGENFQAIGGSTSHGTVIESLYRILSVALPTFDQTLRLLSGDSQEWLGRAGEESAAYSHAFSKMVDLGVDEEDAFTRDLLQMMAQVPPSFVR